MAGRLVDQSVDHIQYAYSPTPEGWALPITYFEEMDRLGKQAQHVVERAIEKLKPSLNKTIALDGQTLPGSPRV